MLNLIWRRDGLDSGAGDEIEDVRGSSNAFSKKFSLIPL